MKIEDGLYVQFGYNFKNESGQVVYESDPENPTWYIQGYGLIMPAMEEALAGHEKDDEFTILLEQEDAFGSRLKKMVSDMPKENFPDDVELKVGMILEAAHEDGHVLPVVITEIKEDCITIDANHPLAGMDLTVDFKVLDVRQPSKEEKLEISTFLNGPKIKSTMEEDGSIMMEFGANDDGDPSIPTVACGCGGSCGSEGDKGNNGGCGC